MDEAIVVFSRKGIMKTRIAAHDVRSREHARKLWPLVSPGPSHQILTWVSPSFEGNKLRRRSHFRVLPCLHSFSLKAHFDHEESSRCRAVQESAEHRRAKELIADELSRRLNSGLGMPWAFKDEEASDYPLEGNLLLGTNRVATEHPLATPFGSKFRLDVAVLGPSVRNDLMVLGGVEVELGHAFDGFRALVGKSLGFPMISIDISEMTMDELTPEWARYALTATTRSHEQGRRQSYFYLHELLYPLYAQLPRFLDDEQRHQFLIFAKDKVLEWLVSTMNMLSDKLEYPKGAVAVSIVNGKSEQARKVLERAGQIVGPDDWREFNSERCLRLTVPRPRGLADLQGHLFHIEMARILLCEADALVGYKYCNGVDNNRPEEDVWIAHRWVADLKAHARHRVLPKRLAYPINRLIKIMSGLHDDRVAASQDVSS